LDYTEVSVDVGFIVVMVGMQETNRKREREIKKERYKE